MSAFPKTTVGLISLFLFVAWLVFTMGIPQISVPMNNMNTATNNAISGVNNASTNIISGDEGLFGFGIISSFFGLIWNLIHIPILFLAQIFVAFATFITVLTMLPIEISGIIVTLIGVGLIMSLLSVVIK